MRSCVYTGRVEHTRSAGVAHTFGYRHALLCLDLDELPHVFDGRWLVRDGLVLTAVGMVGHQASSQHEINES